MALATLGVLSIGEMGLGVAKLLVAHDYRVITNIAGRSQGTINRAKLASIELVETDEDLVTQSDYILSIVPPRDVVATAQRIVKASSAPSFKKRSNALYYLDLNAVSPRSARELDELFKPVSSQIRFIDGGIIGGPPKPKDSSDPKGAWNCPSIPTSGPYELSKADPGGQKLAQVLNTQHISSEIGGASGLKVSTMLCLDRKICHKSNYALTDVLCIIDQGFHIPGNSIVYHGSSTRCTSRIEGTLKPLQSVHSHFCRERSCGNATKGIPMGS